MTMKAMVIEHYGEPLVFKDVPVPEVGDDDVLVQMKVCSICNSDNKLRAGLFPNLTLPRIPGHEPAGIVVERGKNVKDVQLGDHVTFLHFSSCGHCRNCINGRPNNCLVGYKRLGYEVDGGYAEYMLAPAKNALVVPKDLPFEHAALIPDAICTSVHALYDRAKIQEGDTVLISGVGGLGIHGMQVAKAAGCTVIVSDPDERKLQRAKELGADYCFNPTKVDLSAACRELTGGFGVDVAADFVGLPLSDETAFQCLTLTGKLVMVGYQPGTTFQISSQQVAMGEREILGSKNRLWHNMAQGLELVLSGKVKPQVDQRFLLKDANLALDTLKEKGFIGRGVLVMEEGLLQG